MGCRRDATPQSIARMLVFRVHHRNRTLGAACSGILRAVSIDAEQAKQRILDDYGMTLAEMRALLLLRGRSL